MKKHIKIFYFLTICLGISVASCSKEEENKPVLSLSVNVDSILFAQDGSSQSIRITSNTDWVVTGNAAWLEVSRICGSGNETIVLSPSENESFSTRRCVLNIAIEEGDIVCQIKVEQQGSSLLRLSAETISISGMKGSTSTLKITTNAEWHIRNVPEWLTVSEMTGVGSAEVIFTANNLNYSLDVREGVLYLESGSKAAIILVVQEAGLSENCWVEAQNETVLCDGYYADLTFGSDTYRYKEMILEKGVFEAYSERQIWSMVTAQDNSYRAATHNYTVWDIDNANTEYVYCAVAFDIKYSGDTLYGPLATRYFRTKDEESDCDALIGEISYINTSWTVPFTMEGGCSHFYALGISGEEAREKSTYSNIELAIAIVEHHRKYGYGWYTSLSGSYTWTRDGQYDTCFCIWTWGVDYNGEYSGSINSKYIDTEDKGKTVESRTEVKKWNRKKKTRKEWDKRIRDIKVSANYCTMQ